jgi:protein involved in polysaccharide export with SLBB domain
MMMDWYRLLRIGVVCAIGLGLMTACSSSSSTPRTVAAAATTGGESGVEGYRLGAGDRVRVTVFRHVDLSGEFQLDGEGFFAMPLVGEIQGGGLNSRQLETEIEKRLKDGGYLVNPQVGVEVLNYRPFYIIGEVNNPGSYQYVNGMTVINAVALAGGFTYRADQDDIVINRGGSQGPEVEDVMLDTEVLPGDIINVTERFF